MLGRVIVRLPNWLGDTVMAVPALRALRAGLPEARLLLAGPWVAVLAGQSLGDVLVTYPRSWRGRLGSADTVRDFRGEAAVLLPNSFEAAAAALYWGARRRIGFAAGARGPLLTDRLAMPAPRLHQIDEYLLLVAHLGLPAAPGPPRLAPPEPASAERQRARALLAPARGAGRRVIGVHLGAAYGDAKVWPRDRVAELCALLVGEGAAPVLLGAASDAPAVEPVARTTGAASLVGRDSPELLPALLAELDGLVAGDTGVAHLAAALGTPVVALFGPTDPNLTAPRGRATVVRHPVPCAPCFYRTCPIDHPCMRSIDARTVAERLAALAARPA